MEKKSGSCRTVFLIGPLAIKIPRFAASWEFFREVPADIRRRDWKMFRINCQLGWLKLRRPIRENLEEFMACLVVRSWAIPRVYLSLGIISVSRRYQGREATQKEVDKLRGALRARLNGGFERIDSSHLFDRPDNWLREEKRFRIVDAGGLNITALVQSRKEIEEALTV